MSYGCIQGTEEEEVFSFFSLCTTSTGSIINQMIQMFIII